MFTLDAIYFGQSATYTVNTKRFHNIVKHKNNVREYQYKTATSKGLEEIGGNLNALRELDLTS